MESSTDTIATFNESCQLEVAKQIAAVDDKKCRDLLLSLLSKATYLQNCCTEQKKEMETIHKVLVSIEEEMSLDSGKDE